MGPKCYSLCQNYKFQADGEHGALVQRCEALFFNSCTACYRDTWDFIEIESKYCWQLCHRYINLLASENEAFHRNLRSDIIHLLHQ